MIFIICQLIYNRNFSDDTIKIVFYYLIIALFIFILNLIQKKIFKWLIVIFFFILPLTYLFFTDSPNNDFTLIYIMQVAAPANFPLLPDNLWQNLKYSNYQKTLPVLYLIYFILPIIYWYTLYLLAKWVCKIKFTLTK